MENYEIKICPFCGSDALGISTSSGNNCYYKQVYCKKCHTYGPRVRIAVDEMNYSGRYAYEHDEDSNKQAVKKWNNRLERLKV